MPPNHLQIFSETSSAYFFEEAGLDVLARTRIEGSLFHFGGFGGGVACPGSCADSL